MNNYNSFVVNPDQAVQSIEGQSAQQASAILQHQVLTPNGVPRSTQTNFMPQQVYQQQQYPSTNAQSGLPDGVTHVTIQGQRYAISDPRVQSLLRQKQARLMQQRQQQQHMLVAQQAMATQQSQVYGTNQQMLQSQPMRPQPQTMAQHNGGYAPNDSSAQARQQQAAYNPAGMYAPSSANSAAQTHALQPQQYRQVPQQARRQAARQQTNGLQQATPTPYQAQNFQGLSSSTNYTALNPAYPPTAARPLGQQQPRANVSSSALNGINRPNINHARQSSMPVAQNHNFGVPQQTMRQGANAHSPHPQRPVSTISSAHQNPRPASSWSPPSAEMIRTIVDSQLSSMQNGANSLLQQLGARPNINGHDTANKDSEQTKAVTSPSELIPGTQQKRRIEDVSASNAHASPCLKRSKQSATSQQPLLNGVHPQHRQQEQLEGVQIYSDKAATKHNEQLSPYNVESSSPFVATSEISSSQIRAADKESRPEDVEAPTPIHNGHVETQLDSVAPTADPSHTTNATMADRRPNLASGPAPRPVPQARPTRAPLTLPRYVSREHKLTNQERTMRMIPPRLYEEFLYSGARDIDEWLISKGQQPPLGPPPPVVANTEENRNVFAACDAFVQGVEEMREGREEFAQQLIATLTCKKCGLKMLDGCPGH